MGAGWYTYNLPPLVCFFLLFTSHYITSCVVEKTGRRRARGCVRSGVEEVVVAPEVVEVVAVGLWWWWW